MIMPMVVTMVMMIMAMVVTVVVVMMIMAVLVTVVVVVMIMAVLMTVAFRSCTGSSSPLNHFHIRFRSVNRFPDLGQHGFRIFCRKTKLLCRIGHRDIFQSLYLAEPVFNPGSTVGTIQTFQNVYLPLHNYMFLSICCSLILTFLFTIPRSLRWQIKNRILSGSYESMLLQ